MSKNRKSRIVFAQAKRFVAVVVRDKRANPQVNH